MKKWWMCLLAVSLLAASACGAEEEAEGTNNGAENNGAVNNGDANNGDTNNGAVNNGEADMGGQVDMSVPDADTAQDLGSPDQGAQDVGSPDMNQLDTGVDADGPEDVGGPDMDPVDVGPGDVGPGDVGAPDMDPVDVGVDADHPEDVGSPDVEEVDAGSEADMMGGVCPPEGPYGAGEGSTIPSIVLKDCSGQDVDVHSLCEYEVGWMFEFAAWCPPCRAFAAGLNDLYNTFEEGRVGMFFIISQDNNFGAPTASFCQDIKRQYGLDDVTVLYDPNGAFQQQLGVRSNEVNVLTRRGGEIFFNRQYANSQVEGAINAELNR